MEPRLNLGVSKYLASGQILTRVPVCFWQEPMISIGDTLSPPLEKTSA